MKRKKIEQCLSTILFFCSEFESLRPDIRFVFPREIGILLSPLLAWIRLLNMIKFAILLQEVEKYIYFPPQSGIYLKFIKLKGSLYKKHFDFFYLIHRNFSWNFTLNLWFSNKIFFNIPFKCEMWSDMLIFIWVSKIIFFSNTYITITYNFEKSEVGLN